MELWFTEKQTPALSLSLAVTETLHHEKSIYQDIAVLDTIQCGRMLVLDGMVMTTEADEFVYHEMLTHVALFTHPNPEKVLIIGGGDGGTIREAVKHQKVTEVVLAEIDERVVAVSKQFLPSLSTGFADKRVKLAIGDGIKHVQEHENYYDVILIDSTEPVGPGAVLFSKQFYRNVHQALKPDGIMVAQTESPFVNGTLIQRIYKDISGLFPLTHLYYVCIPTYPSGMWTFTMGSKKYDPLNIPKNNQLPFPTKYYNFGVHHGAFLLPELAKKLTETS